MNIGLFFGSFNPVHVGHLIIAEFMSNKLDEVWFVLSPQSPFKTSNKLLDTELRLNMLKIAIGDHEKIKISEVELELPVPSYTIDTLTYLKKHFPKNDFSLIMGADNILGIHDWKSSEEILKHHIYVYPRLGYDVDDESRSKFDDHVKFTDAPILELSATEIRESIANDMAVEYMLHSEVWKYISDRKLYHNLEQKK